jgi:hypothetical protein
MYDLILRFVPHYGWLYLIVRNGIELARGEFHATADAALSRGLETGAKLADTIGGEP